MFAVAVEGDSLAVQMRPGLEARLRVSPYDAVGGQLIHAGVSRVLARHVDGRVVLVSLGSADALLRPEEVRARDVAHEARRLLRAARCVVWGGVRIDLPGYERPQRRVNAGLARVTRLHLVRPLRPDLGDGVHLAPASADRLAGRFARTARREC